MWFEKKNNKILFLVLIIAFILVFIFLQRPVRSFFYSVSQPLQRWAWSKSLEDSGFWSGFFNAKKLRTENADLKQENQLFLSHIIEFNQIEAENKKLRQALDLGLARQFELLEAEILSQDIVKDFIVIDKGSINGVQDKMVVINEQKVLVGQINEVYKNSSRVRLLTDDGFKFGAQIADTDIQALAEGKGNGKIILDLVPQSEQLLTGALVLTGRRESIIASGLLVGKLGKIEKTDLTPFQKADIEPFFNIQESVLLFIIIN